MIIAVMSDSHDNIWNMRDAVSRIKEEQAEMIIHLGDFIAPFMMPELEKAGIPVHGVFGNNDGDIHLLIRLASSCTPPVTLHGITGEVDANGYKIGFAHEPVKAKGLLFEGRYDAVFYGHTHTYSKEVINHTLFLNPGEIMGKDGEPGFVLLDTEKGTTKRIRIGDMS